MSEVSEAGGALPAFRVVHFLPSKTFLSFEICTNLALEIVTGLWEVTSRVYGFLKERK